MRASEIGFSGCRGRRLGCRSDRLEVIWVVGYKRGRPEGVRCCLTNRFLVVQEGVVLLKYIRRLMMSRVRVELLWMMVDIGSWMLLNRSMKLDEVLAMSGDMINCWTNALLGSTLEEGDLEEAVATAGLPLRGRSPAWRTSNKRPINRLMLRFDAIQTVVCSTGGIVKRNVGEGSHS